MKRFIFLCLHFCFFSLLALSQNSDPYFLKGFQLFENQQYQQAIAQFSLSIKKHPTRNKSYYYKTLSEIKLNQYHDAFYDIHVSIQQQPKDNDLYFLRGLIKKNLCLYPQAKNDFDIVIQKDPYHMPARFNRAITYLALHNLDSACRDFSYSKNSFKEALFVFQTYCPDTSSFQNTSTIFLLQQKTTNPKYGTNPNFPIKVGTSIFGAQPNHTAYLDLLRDINNNPIAYEYEGKCCPHKGSQGNRYFLDKYNITYSDKNHKEKNTTLYITHEEYDTPLIPIDFFPIQFHDTLSQPLKNTPTSLE